MRCVLSAAVLLAPVVAEATTVTFQNGVNGYSGASDTYLSSSHPTTNNGSTPQQLIGYSSLENSTDRALYRFDLSSLNGAYSSITSIQLTLTTTTGVGVNNFILSEVNAANGDWISTAATWNNKNENTSALWDGGVGLGTTGYGTSLDSESWGSGPTLIFTISDPATATALVNDFTSGNNEGFFVRALFETADQTGGDGFVGINSSNSTTIASRPQLTVTYAPLPEPSTAFLLFGGMALLGFRRKR